MTDHFRVPHGMTLAEKKARFPEYKRPDPSKPCPKPGCIAKGAHWHHGYAGYLAPADPPNRAAGGGNAVSALRT